MRQVIDIDLKDHIPPNATALNTSNLGIRLRHASDIDELGKEYKELRILIPDQINAISTAFLQEFLANVKLSLGENSDGTQNRVRLFRKGEEAFKPYLKDAIQMMYANEFSSIP